jgi:hypothetical protein
MLSSELARSIASDVTKDLFEGGPGSGNWGHKGRPGHRGGSLPGGGKGTGISAHVTGSDVKFLEGEKVRINYGEHKGKLATFQEYSPSGSFAIVRIGKKAYSYHESDLLATGSKAKRGTGGGVSAHVVKPGVHASTFYDKSGALKTNEYRKLTDKQKTAVLSHGIQKYKEQYVPKAKQGSMSEAQKSANKKVGALEGMRRAAISKASGFARGSGEWRAATHVAISLQQQVGKVVGTMKSQAVGTAATAATAARQAGAQPGG